MTTQKGREQKVLTADTRNGYVVEEVLMIEKAAYTKAVEALKEISKRAERPETNNHLASVARETLKELGEI